MVNYQLYGIGHVIVDEYYSVSEAQLQQLGLIKGQRTLISPEQLKALRDALSQVEVQRQAGGSGANSIATAAMFGSKCVFAGRHSHDANGLLFDQNLSQNGITAHMEITQGGPTGTCMVMITPDGERTMQTCTGVTDDLDINSLNQSLLSQSQCLFLEGYLITTPLALTTALGAVKLAKQHGVKVAMSFADPAMVKLFSPQLRQVVELGLDWLFCNEEEALLFSQTDNLDEACVALQQYSQGLCITLGEKGAMARLGSEQSHAQANKVTAIDTNGAGDAFAGAFLHAILSGQSLTAAAQLAVNTSTLLVTQTATRITTEQAHQLQKEG